MVGFDGCNNLFDSSSINCARQRERDASASMIPPTCMASFVTSSPLSLLEPPRVDFLLGAAVSVILDLVNINFTFDVLAFV